MILLRPLLTENDNDHYDALHQTGFWGRQGAGCIFLAKSTKRILLPYRSRSVEQPHTWGVWGGAMDSNEDPKDAVKRETREETGYNGNLELTPLYIFQSGTFKYYNFLAIVDDEFEPILNWETDDYKWVDFGDWPSPLHFGLKSLLENDGEKIKQHIATLIETKIITPEESILNGEITVYHGTTWEIAQKAKNGSLGPIDIHKHIANILTVYYDEPLTKAVEIVKDSLSIRKGEPSVLFLTPDKESAIGYARSSTQFGGEAVLDVLTRYLQTKGYKNEDIFKNILTKNPAVVTITMPLKMLLTHPNWNTPAIKRLNHIILNSKKYKYKIKVGDWAIELFVKETIPAKYIQRIDRV